MAHKISNDCVACGSCQPNCPVGAIKEGTPYSITDDCVDCGSCVSACPVSAITAP